MNFIEKIKKIKMGNKFLYILVFLFLSSCSTKSDGTFNWIDGHIYRNLEGGLYCASDGSPIFWQRANSKGKFTNINNNQNTCM